MINASNEGICVEVNHHHICLPTFKLLASTINILD